MSDLCLDEFTDHGHCGVLDEDGNVDNDATLELLARQAVCHARAGADVIAPSGMMDGMVGTIRSALDGAGHTSVAILSYAAKYASILIVNGLDPSEMLPILTIVQNVYTDPQVPNIVESKLYEIGPVNENSPVLWTTNFSLTYFCVVGEIERSITLFREARETFKDQIEATPEDAAELQFADGRVKELLELSKIGQALLSGILAGDSINASPLALFKLPDEDK